MLLNDLHVGLDGRGGANPHADGVRKRVRREFYRLCVVFVSSSSSLCRPRCCVGFCIVNILVYGIVFVYSVTFFSCKHIRTNTVTLRTQPHRPNPSITHPPPRHTAFDTTGCSPYPWQTPVRAPTDRSYLSPPSRRRGSTTNTRCSGGSRAVWTSDC